jgi:hypothetical protein
LPSASTSLAEIPLDIEIHQSQAQLIQNMGRTLTTILLDKLSLIQE